MNFFREMFERNKVLSGLGMAFLFLSVILIILIPGNETEVLGINSLIKPLKFSLSIWIYCLTMAWLLFYFENKKTVRRLTWLIVGVMLFEQIVITVQAFRGKLSHFNISTGFESALFSLMGVAITVLTLYTLFAALQFRKQSSNLSKARRESIFWGMLIFVVGSFVGGVMGGILSHSVGGEMGGTGLPLINWSIDHGDLRVAHFIGIHALQVVPLGGFLWEKWPKSEEKAVLGVRLISFGYAVMMIFAFAQAMLGVPLLPGA